MDENMMIGYFWHPPDFPTDREKTFFFSLPFHFPSFPPGFTYIIVVVIIPVNMEGD